MVKVHLEEAEVSLEAFEKEVGSSHVQLTASSQLIPTELGRISVQLPTAES
jgi:hypothetical protein